MKKIIEKYFKLWFLAVPIILLASLFQLTADLAEQGQLRSPFLRETIYPLSRSINGAMTNLKFRLRGQEKVKQKIVILAADDAAVERFGRWPWHREIYAYLIHTTFKMGAKAMGLDMVLSESENRVPEALFDKISQSKLDPALIEEIRSLNTDNDLAMVINRYKNQLVLGYVPHALCQPRYEAQNPEICPVSIEDHNQKIQQSIGKFALEQELPFDLNLIYQTPMLYIAAVLNNLPLFADAARYSGTFAVAPDPDGFIRRYVLMTLHQKKIFPSLALQLAEIATQSKAKLSFHDDARAKELTLGDTHVPITPLGYVDLNFHAGAGDLNYPTVSAADFSESAEKQDGRFNELFKDSIVIFGATALGIFDMRAFPFNPIAPGVEGHATALDNILTGDALRSASAINLEWLPLILLWLLGIGFAVVFAELEAVPSIIAFGAFLLVSGIVDMLLFKKQINFPSAFILIEVSSVFVLIQSIRYILEERNKKFIRLAFSHYLAPQVVDYVLKDPSKLEIGGERRELSVLFTDIRGFTTLSEKMEPKELSNFLNEYLTAMTNVIFEFGGTLDKYIGDAVMAFWGAPVFRDDHAYQAAIAALHMQKKMDELQVHFKQKYKAELSMGVGINSGVVSVGNMGSSKIFDYTVIGDHVNLASRLEGLNRIYGTGVLCSQFVLEKMPEELRAKMHYRLLDSVKVKGKKTAIEIVELSLNPVDAESYKLFQQARSEFKKQNWDLAAQLFAQSNTLYQTAYGRADTVCELFIERCSDFKANPPGESWDGSIEMREK